MISTADIAWLAGLLEGEGSFFYKTSPAIRLKMADRDVVERAGRLLGVRQVMPQQPDKRHPEWKLQYLAQLYSAPAAGWMMTIYQFMGVRRKERIRDVLARWCNAPGRWPSPSKQWKRYEPEAPKKTKKVRHPQS